MARSAAPLSGEVPQAQRECRACAQHDAVLEEGTQRFLSGAGEARIGLPVLQARLVVAIELNAIGELMLDTQQRQAADVEDIQTAGRQLGLAAARDLQLPLIE